jgi:hypothetical protein
MRLSDLMKREVVDAGGERLGRVHDVRLVQDGPIVPGFGALLRVDGLVVGRGGLALRVGYHRAQVRGPWMLAKILGVFERRARYVPWDAVTDWRDAAVQVRAPAEGFGPPPVR